ncbi:alpha/beta hydrolase [Pseudochelatococcus contaminans]|uniref:Alpha-beta hydrolase superfamily lysophospholipase n=1 Tax=Pseudochelatococcus contaminans TaxID=1538103 RepID=A0A7W6EFZ4_9HYPH|nr:alpha/beta fold hydrolase [Pseudochelatococcus contaminans]MBB3808612.1 alpha-beta hydrolase superfamily lysophospholipase [Pseudochelatococcus contaminans]
MPEWVIWSGVFLAGAVAIYLLLALALIAISQPKTSHPTGEGIDFNSAIAADYADMPTLKTVPARDGEGLRYRIYGDAAAARRLVVLIHGSGWHGMQFHTMARWLAVEATALVVVPDLRGHGDSPRRRGDIDYIGQLEDDLADLIESMVKRVAGLPVIVGGHSSGGGLAVRFAGGDHTGKVDGYVLLAPFLKYNAPTVRRGLQSWASAAIPRIIGLSMLNAVGITAFNHLPVIAFAMPRQVLEGPYGATVTGRYSYRLNTSFAPRSDYRRDLACIRKPLFVVAGDADEAFDAARYEPLIAAQTATGEYAVVPGVNHIELLADQATLVLIRDWIDRHFPISAKEQR